MFFCEKKMKNILLFFFLFISCFSLIVSYDSMKRLQIRHRKQHKVLVVVPGLGRKDRLSTVAHNIKILKLEQQNNTESSHSIKFQIDCTIYIYTSRENREFWAPSRDLEYLFEHCKVIENPGHMITENLFMLQPHFLQSIYDYVFILLDDVKIANPHDFSLPNILQLMQCNNLHITTPMVFGAMCCGNRIMKRVPEQFLKSKCCSYRSIMQIPPDDSTVAGYNTKFAEMFAWVLSMQGYQLLWDLLSPNLNPYGWGHDLWLHGYASSILNSTEIMGIVTDYKVYHIQGSSVTSSVPNAQKVNAIYRQQEYYQKYLKIPLHDYSQPFLSEHIDTAVLGYLKKC